MRPVTPVLAMRAHRAVVSTRAITGELFKSETSIQALRHEAGLQVSEITLVRWNVLLNLVRA